MMLFLIFITAMAISHICDCRELRRQDHRQENRLAALENDVMDIKGRLLPNPGCLLLDKDDYFKLPPPAYELREGFED